MTVPFPDTPRGVRVRVDGRPRDVKVHLAGFDTDSRSWVWNAEVTDEELAALYERRATIDVDVLPARTTLVVGPTT